MSFLDVRTILVIQMALHIVCALVIAVLWRQYRARFDGLSLWVADYLLLVLATALIALRGRIPDWASVTIPGPLVIFGTLLLYVGLQRFLGRPGPQLHNYLLVALYAGAHAFFTHVQPSLMARNLLLSSALLVLSAQCAWLLARRVEPALRRAALGAGAVFAAYCLVNAVRIVLILSVSPANEDLFRSGTADALVLLSYQMLFILLSFSLALLVNARLLAERAAFERLLQEKNVELERFVYSVSHDLKSPLITVTTYLGYLGWDLERQDAGNIRDDMRFMRTAAERMERMLEDLLELSRIGRVRNAETRFAFRELADEVLALVAGRIAERRAAVKVTGPSVTLHGDRARLVEVWQNLVDNAVKFMGSQPAPAIEIGVERRGGETEFFVRDNGVGIDPAFGEKVFELFRKLDPASEGTGLGLALVKRIVELHQGRIWLETPAPGAGACFRFTLPSALAA